MFKGFQKPKRLVANTETLTERFGQFTAQPFQRGFGTTIGNSLRRVLLSSIEGAAITAIRIEGVDHEFSPIPGVVEDATDIILNLKQVPFKVMGEGIKTVRLVADKAGEVFSGADRDRRRRRSARPQSAHRNGQRRRQARYRNAPQARPRLRQRRQEFRRRPGHRLHPDRLGALARAQSELHGRSRASRSDDRLRQADARSLDQRRHLAAGRHRPRREAAERSHDDLHQLRRAPEAEEPTERSHGSRQRSAQPLVEELELSVRSYNCLKNAGIQTIGELVQKSESEMLRTKNFGRKSLNEIKEILTAWASALGMKPDAHGRLVAPPPPAPGSIRKIFRTTSRTNNGFKYKGSGK
jgi:DNA-directed RNA polymerase subunit alpha